jgi:DNA repair protein RadC
MREMTCEQSKKHALVSTLRNPAPSSEDRQLTARLKECGTLLGIEILDHVIVGNGTGRWFSFRDVGEL